MALPKIAAPIFELNLPSTGQAIKYRPFLVKEQKILLLALESDDQKSITTAIKQIINNCAIDPVDVDTLPTFDLEYFFVRLRAKSINEKVDLRMAHPGFKNKLGEECSHQTTVSFDLMELEVIKTPNHVNKILLDEKGGIGIKLKYPTMTIDATLTGDESQMELATISILNSIDYIYDNENVYKKEDHTKQELLDFIDNLSQDQFTKLASFFETMPKLKHMIKWKCGKCGQEDQSELEGMSNFFVF
jgi:hypothetical protein